MPITIREIADDELYALLCLYAHLHPEDEMPPLGEAIPLWKTLRQDPNQHFLGAYWNGSLAATCTLIVIPNLTRGGRPYGLIENVVTHPDYRRRGLGTAVLKHALQFAWERRCYKVMLLTGSKQEAILRFYDQAGFQRGIKTGFVALPGNH
jgi:GNAT superfamily N-acetyltransferase